MKSRYELKVLPKLNEIKELLSKGAFEKDIYKHLGIGKTTWNKYKNEHKELSDLLTQTVNETAPKMEQTLKNCALGYDYTEQQAIKKKKVFYNEQGQRCEEEVIEIVEVKKHHPPQLDALKFWMINKDKGNWALNPHSNDLKKELNDIKKTMQEKNNF